MPLTKQVCDCRISDIIRFKNKESRLITRIDYNPHKRKPYAIRTVDLRDECRARLNTYDALDLAHRARVVPQVRSEDLPWQIMPGDRILHRTGDSFGLLLLGPMVQEAHTTTGSGYRKPSGAARSIGYGRLLIRRVCSDA